ncbi:MAG: YchF/TatD family DNA exonuclease [Candidatus Aenigmarchaeota archaeon]|nr:YchF/TatD family DNA exonuclease [Candidatus Aenigmarchaeota archaeon]
MIDVHCHLEQEDYDKDRDEVIEKCKKELKAVITSCAHPKDFELTMRMVENHKNFVFASCGIHPEYIKEISEKAKDNFLELITENKEKIAAIGETGLDYWYTKEVEWREKQKQLFIQLIEVAKELNKPLIIHCRDAFEDTIKILEHEDAKQVMLHMWGGHKFLKRVLENEYYISMNTIILRSKSYRKVVRDCPLDRLMLETDAPWLAPKKLIERVETRNDPTSIKVVAEKMADIKKISFEEIWNKCGENAVNFFKLPI